MQEIGYHILRPIVKWAFILKYRPTVIGKENIPKKGAIILCGNHRHVADQFNPLIVTRRAVHYMAKKEYFESKQRWFFKMVGCIPVDRSIHDESAKVLAKEVLEHGGALGIFPEGTRNKTFGTPEEVELLPFKYGAVSLAKKTGALIVPFGTRGEYTGKKGNLITHIGKPIDISKMGLDEANELLRKNILKLMKKK